MLHTPLQSFLQNFITQIIGYVWLFLEISSLWNNIDVVIKSITVVVVFATSILNFINVSKNFRKGAKNDDE